MPHQNRVTPFGDIIATPERGTTYGNRGCIVNRDGKIARAFKETRWLICVLNFKERKHPMMAPGLYTGLFFLDEATALAAGHRPCFECQRDRAEEFRKAWATANPALSGDTKPSVAVLDSALHRERLGPRPRRRSIDGLPDGTFVTDNGADAYLVLQNRSWLWSPGGYQPAEIRGWSVEVLTPPSIVNTLAAGYPARIHPSAYYF